MTWSLLFFTTNIFLGIGLAMDAFSVSMANGLNEPHMNKGRVCTIAGVFGGFQALMPMIGYLLGSRFVGLITNITPWIAFALLTLIGVNMIRETFSKEEKEETSAAFGFKTMLVMAVATSIDALAVGITFACIPVTIIRAGELFNTFIAVLIIGLCTFIISICGVKVGNVFGARYKNKAEFAGGIILILLGIKILLEYFGIKLF